MSRRFARILLLTVCPVALRVALAPSVAADTDWLEKVPARESARVNPLNNDPEAAGAGAKLYLHDCASCHRSDALGDRRHPSLRTGRVRDLTDGDLQWLLKNGDLAHGMPSWSRLPQQQRWQIIRYLRTLPEPPG